VATPSSPKRSPRSSARSERSTPAPVREQSWGFDQEEYMEHSHDHVARVRAARDDAKREMESFGDVSEYEITVIHGQLREKPHPASQPTLDFDAKERG
jgi:hypothetical protein